MNFGWFRGIDRDRQAGDFAELSATKSLIVMQEMSLCDISVITTKVPCGVSLMSERHVYIEICISLCKLLSKEMVVRRRREDYHEGSARISAVFVVFCFLKKGDLSSSEAETKITDRSQNGGQRDDITGIF